MKLTFEDLSLTCVTSWCISENAALKYLRSHFVKPSQALMVLLPYFKNHHIPYDFWESL